MPFQFSDPAPYRFKDGDIFLGVDDQGQEIGLETERHAIAVAGAGTGKGAALIIPNLLRWQASTLCIDPKGENAERTYQAREAMGQTVGVLDPFHAAEIPARLRVSINVLSGIDPASRTARGDVETIADGLVKRSDPKHAEWDDGAASVLAGVIAYVLADPPPEGASLPLIRRVLLQGKDDLYADAQRMLACDACGGLAKAAGATIMAAVESDKGMEKDFLGGARRHSAWLDDPAIADVLGASTFNLSSLKTGAGSLYLVLPPHYIDSKAAFLRLFVRSALNTMAAGGSGKGGRCLFLLDEFYALGRLDIVAKAAGLMRSYGVSLFPFLQDLGQLQELYGVKGAETFFGNADAHIFFGNSDTVTLQYVSDRVGRLTPDELDPSPPTAPRYPSAADQAEHSDAVAAYNHRLKRAGSPRFAPSEVAALVGKSHGDKVARSMIVFGKSGDVLNLGLLTYFGGNPAKERAEAAARHQDAERESWRAYLSKSNYKLMPGIIKQTLKSHYSEWWFLYIVATIWTAIATFGAVPYRIQSFIINFTLFFIIPISISCWNEYLILRQLKREYFPERYQHGG